MLGPYRLVEELGTGGMGVVHLALDRGGRAVALKVLRAHVADDAEARTRLEREVATLSRITDPGSPRSSTRTSPAPSVYRHPVRPRPSLDGWSATMALMDPRSFGSPAAWPGRSSPSTPPAWCTATSSRATSCSTTRGDPVLIDFGIAHLADDVRITVTGLVMGTPGYLSPEVINGGAVTAATDWWGWAATLAFAASGAPPFGGGAMDGVLSRVRLGSTTSAASTSARPAARGGAHRRPGRPPARRRRPRGAGTVCRGRRRDGRHTGGSSADDDPAGRAVLDPRPPPPVAPPAPPAPAPAPAPLLPPRSTSRHLRQRGCGHRRPHRRPSSCPVPALVGHRLRMSTPASTVAVGADPARSRRAPRRRRRGWPMVAALAALLLRWAAAVADRVVTSLVLRRHAGRALLRCRPALARPVAPRRRAVATVPPQCCRPWWGRRIVHRRAGQPARHRVAVRPGPVAAAGWRYGGRAPMGWIGPGGRRCAGCPLDRAGRRAGGAPGRPWPSA